jgi:hypothetical protein
MRNNWNTYVRLQNLNFANCTVLCGNGRDLWDRNRGGFRDLRFKNLNMADLRNS